MMKKLKRLSAALLSLATLAALTVPALAVPAEDYAVLNVRYRPNGAPVNDVEYRLYKVADAQAGEDGYVYTLTQPFEASEIDVNEILGGGQLTAGENASAQRDLLAQFGTYINDNQETVREHAETALTGSRPVGADQHVEDGVARFTGLDDGLYLVTCSHVHSIGRTRYTPVPFLINIPYVMDGVTNNYLTATVKFTTYTPPRPRPDPETPPVDPENPPVDPEIPDNPTDPDNPPDIDITEPDVPLVDLPEEPGADIEIPDEEPPLAELPQTGLLWWPVPVLAAAGAASVAFGVLLRKKEGRDA